MKEFEEVVASFQQMNDKLRARHATASKEIGAYCARHIAQNERTIRAMQKSLGHVETQIAEESR